MGVRSEEAVYGLQHGSACISGMKHAIQSQGKAHRRLTLRTAIAEGVKGQCQQDREGDTQPCSAVPLA